MTESKPKLADINAMFSRCWGPLWDCLKVGGEKHGWESFRENDTDLFINAGARHNTEVRKDQKSYDKDGFYHAAAVLANALMVLENVMRDIEEENNYNGSHTGEDTEDMLICQEDTHEYIISKGFRFIDLTTGRWYYKKRTSLMSAVDVLKVCA